MNTAPSPTPVPVPTDGDGPCVSHLYCCIDKDIALCGKDISDYQIKHDPRDYPCVPCENADAKDACPRAGSCAVYSS